MFRRVSIAVVFVLLALPAIAAKRRAAGVPKPYPQCAMVLGTGAVTFTLDQGQTLAPTAEPLRGLAYTYGLVTMPGQKDTLMAFHRDQLLLSTDAGCSWRSVATVGGADFPPTLAPALDGRVYIWSDNRSFLVRYDARGTKVLKPPADFVGFAVDPNDGDHIRAGGGDGAIWESLDAGESWNPLGRINATGEVLYRFVFDPHDLDHVVAGMTRQGAFVTRDAGRNWSRATGLTKGNANAFNFAISPADASRVWAMAIDLSYTDDDPAHGRHVYLSTDGGLTYGPVVDEGDGVKLINGPLLVPHPANRDVLYFVFGTHFQAYGTDLFRYDYATRALTLTHNDYDDINAIAFAASDLRVMYLGLSEEQSQ
jgi:hypothetical protein